jgi:hypothetical protein
LEKALQIGLFLFLDVVAGALGNVTEGSTDRGNCPVDMSGTEQKYRICRLFA